MRPLNDDGSDPRGTPVAQRDARGAQDRSAPVSAARPASSFWDHLGAVRADEYARDEILGGLIPPRRSPQPPPQSGPAPDPASGAASGPRHRAAPGASQSQDAGAMRAPLSGASPNWPEDAPATHGREGASMSAGARRTPSPGQASAAFPLASPPLAMDQPSQGWPLGHDPRPQGLDPAVEPPGLGLRAPGQSAQRRGRADTAQRRGRADTAQRRGRADTAQSRRADPAPSRLSYRLNRLWLTPVYRRMLTIGLPVCALATALIVVFSDPGRQDFLRAQIEAAYSAFAERPEFMVTEIQLPDVSPELKDAIAGRIELDLPLSSFRLDLDVLRGSIEGLDAIRSVDLRLLGDGVLAVAVAERVPVALWRSAEGLELIDREGQRVGFALSRAARPDLPLIAGEGANKAIAEALALVDAARPLSSRMIGLVRVGARRWDLVLDREQRIMLPETHALVALERVIALDQAQDLLARDMQVADFRLPVRPVLRLGEGALETIFEIRQ